MMVKLCAICGLEVVKKPSESKAYFATKRFCSTACMGIGRRGWRHTAETRRKLLGKVFSPEVLAKRKAALPRGSANNLWKGGEVTLTCKTCNSTFCVKPYRKDTAKYCSRKCKTDDNQGLTKANERVRKSKAYREWRDAVFKRDNYTCVKCNQRGGELNADHIKPFSIHHDLRLDVSNGRTLCVSCHRQTDTFGIKLVRVSKKSLVAAINNM